MGETCWSCEGPLVPGSIPQPMACSACGSPQGAFLTLQRSLAGLIAVGFGALWYVQTPLSGGSGTAEPFVAPGAEPSSALGVVVALLVVGVLAALLGCGKPLVLGARDALKRRSEPGSARILLAQFLIAWVAAMFVEALVGALFVVPLQLSVANAQGAATVCEVSGAGLRFGPGPATEDTKVLRETEPGLWQVVGRGRHVTHVEVAALGSDVSVTLSWRLGAGKLSLSNDAPAGDDGGGPVAAVSSGALTLNGVAAADGARVRSGDRLGVGAFKASLSGSSWSSLVRGVAAGKIAALLALLIGCLALGGRALLPALGLSGDGAAREAGRGLVALLAFVPLYVALVGATQAAALALGIPVESHPLVHAILDEGGAELIGLVVLQAVVLAPILEELIFRGFLLSAGERALGRPAALLLSAASFSLIHAGFASLLPMFGLGLLFGLLRLGSPRGSLVAPIVAHACFNAFSLSLLFAAGA